MWELDVFEEERGWKTVARKPSADACKAAARQHHRSSTGTRPDLAYRVYAADGQQLAFISSGNNGWRMRWGGGNLKSRDRQLQQAGPAIFPATNP